jgi:hypothetical protein
METSYWVKQTLDNPVFSELLWSQPQNKLSAGKLLIIGGNLHSFAAVGESYNDATVAGIGSIRILLPDSLKNTVGKLFPAAEFGPSTPSGSFSQNALAPILDNTNWADAILVAGDLGRNAETAIMLESLLDKSSIPIAITQDGVDYVSSTPKTASNRKNLLLVLSLSQLQRLATSLKYHVAIKYSMDLLRLSEWLHNFTTSFSFYIVVEHQNIILAAVDGQVSSTKLALDMPIWRVKIAAYTVVWWLQNKERPFAALTTAIAAPFIK